MFETGEMSNIQIINRDCMEMLPQVPDKYYDLCICDPPYFDGPQKPGYYAGTKQRCKVGQYKSLKSSWKPLNKRGFNEIKRVSKNQIIWGINYFNVKAPGGRIVWIKGEMGSPFSIADIAYHSFYRRIDVFKYTWSGFWQEAGQKKEKRIHPTQKPVALYQWLLKNYAKPGDKILDTHGGSCSLAIACDIMGYDCTIYEIDKDYYNAAVDRFKRHKQQLTLEGIA